LRREAAKVDLEAFVEATTELIAAESDSEEPGGEGYVADSLFMKKT